MKKVNATIEKMTEKMDAKNKEMIEKMDARIEKIDEKIDKHISLTEKSKRKWKQTRMEQNKSKKKRRT